MADAPIRLSGAKPDLEGRRAVGQHVARLRRADRQSRGVAGGKLEHVYKLCGQHSRANANGVAQVCFIGVINPQNPRVESPDEVRDALMEASKHIPKERLGSTDDCGFSPFSIKPKHGSPDVARDIAFQKITSRVKGTAMASEKLGLA
jgi:hypothetical protein